MVICLERGADLHMAQLMPLPLTVSCCSKIQIGFTFLVLAHLGSPGKGPLNGCCLLLFFCKRTFWNRSYPSTGFLKDGMPCHSSVKALKETQRSIRELLVNHYISTWETSTGMGRAAQQAGEFLTYCCQKQPQVTELGIKLCLAQSFPQRIVV